MGRKASRDEQITTWLKRGRGLTIGYGQPPILFFNALELIARQIGRLWVLILVHLSFLVW